MARERRYRLVVRSGDIEDGKWDVYINDQADVYHNWKNKESTITVYAHSCAMSQEKSGMYPRNDETSSAREVLGLGHGSDSSSFPGQIKLYVHVHAR